MNLKKVKERIRHILHLDETPHDLARAFAAGVFVAFSPFIGLHTVMVLLLAWAFRLNKVVALTGTFVNNPWTIAFVYIGPTWVFVQFMRYLGMPIRKLNYALLEEEFRQTLELYSIWQPRFWTTFLNEFKPYLSPFLLGTTIAGIAASLCAYVVIYFGVKYYRKKKHDLRAVAP
jgi:uncharacterized protein (DUF2062 family)